MAFWQHILVILLGDAGPADIVVTRDSVGARIRLPTQRNNRVALSIALIVSLAFGPIGIYALISGTMNLPHENRDLEGMWISVSAILTLIVGLALCWRIVWHYEISISPQILRVDCITSFHHEVEAQIDLAAIGQFTIINDGKGSSLQTESKDVAPRVLLRNQEHHFLVRVADLLTQECGILEPDKPRLRVTVETSLVGVQTERITPPLNSKVVAFRNDTGITLDFLLPEDDRVMDRRRAWRTFEIGVCLLMGSVIWFAVCAFFEWIEVATVATVAFIAGLLFLVTAANRSFMAWAGTKADDDLRQLSVAGNLLIRTARDHRKQIWYRHEIREIALRESVETHESSEGGATYTYRLLVTVVLHNDERGNLMTMECGYPLTDYRPRAELEWIATLLRQALHTEAPSEPTAPRAEPASEAIRDLAPRPPETRISSA